MNKNVTALEILDDRPRLPSARDIAAIFFRRGRLVSLIFLIGALPVILWSFRSSKYESQMKILVRRERLDPMITPQHDAPAQIDRDQVSEEDLNSEVELIKSSDLLRKAVLMNNLQNSEHPHFVAPSALQEIKVAKAVEHLARGLTARPVQKTNLISVAYESKDPQTAAKVLDTIATLYVEKHLEVHRPPGQLRFFDQQTEHYRTGVQQAEQQLSQFTREKGVAAAQMERDLALQKLSDFERTANQERADIYEAEQRIRVLQNEQQTTLARISTQKKTSDNAQLMEIMKSTLLNLNLKRSELLASYNPSYRPIKDLDEQIAETNRAIESELRSPIREESTDRNQIYDWITSEITKSNANLAGLKTKANADLATLDSYRKAARQLQQDGILQSDLLRDVKVQEDSYLLYQQKREEARINEALDQRGIINVAISEPPMVSSLPVHPAWLICIVGLLGISVGSLGIALITDLLDPSFKTPDQLALVLGVPVLAALPRRMSATSPN